METGDAYISSQDRAELVPEAARVLREGGQPDMATILENTTDGARKVRGYELSILCGRQVLNVICWVFVCDTITWSREDHGTRAKKKNRKYLRVALQLGMYIYFLFEGKCPHMPMPTDIQQNIHHYVEIGTHRDHQACAVHI